MKRAPNEHVTHLRHLGGILAKSLGLARILAFLLFAREAACLKAYPQHCSTQAMKFSPAEPVRSAVVCAWPHTVAKS